MNTKNEQDQKKNQRQKTRPKPESKRRSQNRNVLADNRKHQYHEQELIATRMTD